MWKLTTPFKLTTATPTIATSEPKINLGESECSRVKIRAIITVNTAAQPSPIFRELMRLFTQLRPLLQQNRYDVLEFVQYANYPNRFALNPKNDHISLYRKITIIFQQPQLGAKRRARARFLR